MKKSKSKNKKDHGIIRRQSKKEEGIRDDFVKLFKESPLPDNEILSNLGLYMNRKALSRVLYIDDLYKKILDTHGVVMEFGVRWGQNLALFESLRGMYEPYNYTRKIVGFDTFEGAASLDEKDGKVSVDKSDGAFSVSGKYEKYLEKVLDYHEKESPVSHIQKYELVKGDAVNTIKKYLKDHPETIIAFAYFDFGLYTDLRFNFIMMDDYDIDQLSFTVGYKF